MTSDGTDDEGPFDAMTLQVFLADRAKILGLRRSGAMRRLGARDRRSSGVRSGLQRFQAIGLEARATLQSGGSAITGLPEKWTREPRGFLIVAGAVPNTRGDIRGRSRQRSLGFSLSTFRLGGKLKITKRIGMRFQAHEVISGAGVGRGA
ncbi:hypothetical protein BSKO_04616 [Bryopsis sp. KO-2023]|nr:hypothetical protein BSKO_04616 [Bryopsis sp. KO-2023]